jgi:hypothetical protein
VVFFAFNCQFLGIKLISAVANKTTTLNKDDWKHVGEVVHNFGCGGQAKAGAATDSMPPKAKIDMMKLGSCASGRFPSYNLVSDMKH